MFTRRSANRVRLPLQSLPFQLWTKSTFSYMTWVEVPSMWRSSALPFVNTISLETTVTPSSVDAILIRLCLILLPEDSPQLALILQRGEPTSWRDCERTASRRRRNCLHPTPLSLILKSLVWRRMSRCLLRVHSSRMEFGATSSYPLKFAMRRCNELVFVWCRVGTPFFWWAVPRRFLSFEPCWRSITAGLFALTTTPMKTWLRVPAWWL